ncbi:1-deoxy-D-xylulose 5-phosphate reductoisomerase [bioreactor metagenome]|uniref:1-deoxy-D-xylulose-5-phosphate reductoisomerase n=1 Tax=bioreactor metagenome TaxID=1076179 RepID=A0A645F8W4_9ZZZZ
MPTIEAIKAGKTIALANKETLVTAGSIIMSLAKENGVRIIPVDSEHSAIFQCLNGADQKEIKKIILTASGGPFFGKTKEELKQVTVSQALKHPNWSMGSKITIDSATLMNKGLEFIEAMHLFEVEPDQIDILVHRESIIHSMVEFCDHSVIAQLSVPDMTLPIQYAVHYPKRNPAVIKELDLTQISTLTFFKPDMETFTALPLAIRAAKEGTTACAVLNGANEEAVSLFLKEEIGFLQIAQLVQRAVTDHKIVPNPSIEDVLHADRWARDYVLNHK